MVGVAVVGITSVMGLEKSKGPLLETQPSVKILGLFLNKWYQGEILGAS